MAETPALDGFAGETRSGHALTVAGGVAACWIGYFGAAALVGDLAHVAPDSDATAVIRAATMGAGVACWGYFALAFVLARGGPVLDAAVYPLAILAIAPTVGRWVVFGPAPGLLFSRLVGFSLEPLVLALVAFVPGFGTFVAILAVWASRLDESQRREWERTCLTEAFYDAFVE